MINRIVNFSCDPPQPKAGQSFRLTVQLSEKAATDVQVSLEKQRIVANVGGFLELRPTGADYFDEDPKPIKVSVGTAHGTSDEIKVKKRPQADPPVIFPEQLLFTAFIGQLSEGFRSMLVLILLPHEG